MGDTYIRNYSDSDSDDSPVYVARDPRKDKHFERKQELLWNCKKKVGRISEHRQPLTIAVIGPPGSGKSSFLNTVFAAFSNDHWEEYAKYGDFSEMGRHFTRRLKRYLVIVRVSLELSQTVMNIFRVVTFQYLLMSRKPFNC